MKRLAHVLVPSLAALCCLPAGAQNIEARSGLWASASQATLNGRKLPTIFDIQGVPADRKAALAAAMAKFGLPEGWSPRLECATSSTYDPQAIARKTMGESNCAITITEQRRDGARYTMVCSGDGMQGSGQGEAHVVNGTQSRMSFSISGTVQGQPATYEAKTVGQWIAADCNKPPPGISPDWLKGGS